jgi:hypothetical protein
VLKERLPAGTPLAGLDTAGARAALGPRQRRLFEPLLADEEEFGRQRAVYLAASKVEFAYHEVSRRGGYFQQLREAGDILSLVDDDDALAAQLRPPPRTRAAIRGRAIALAADPRDLEASWETIRVNSLRLSVTIRDPSVHRVPPRR